MQRKTIVNHDLSVGDTVLQLRSPNLNHSIFKTTIWVRRVSTFSDSSINCWDVGSDDLLRLFFKLKAPKDLL